VPSAKMDAQGSSQGVEETTWKWQRVRRTMPEKGRGRSARRGFLRLPRASREVKVTLRVVYRGGAECWWLVEARGEAQVFPGYLALEDVMARVLSER
jgi:hypothetical protein